MRSNVTGWIVAAALLLVSRSVEANAILNGGFETPGFGSWSVDAPSPASLMVEGGGAHSGSSAAWFGSMGSVDDTIAQSLVSTPGEAFLVDFWLAHDASDSQNDFRVWWNGTLLMNLVGARSFGYTPFSFVTTADAATSTIMFGGRDVLSYYRLDDVDVHPLTSAPEPTTLALLASGVFVAWTTRRRRQRLCSES